MLSAGSSPHDSEFAQDRVCSNDSSARTTLSWERLCRVGAYSRVTNFKDDVIQVRREGPYTLNVVCACRAHLRSICPLRVVLAAGIRRTWAPSGRADGACFLRNGTKWGKTFAIGRKAEWVIFSGQAVACVRHSCPRGGGLVKARRTLR